VRSAAPPPRDSAGFIPWWLLGLVAAACLLAALVFAAAAALTRSADLPRPTATVALVTAPAVPAAATAPAVPITPPGGVAEPPTATPPAPPPGDVQIGAYVQVTGTGDAGFLNLRSEPSLQAGVNYLALEREVFQVQAGPTEADGFVWWYLVDPATGSRFGWGVQNYLQVVQGP